MIHATSEDYRAGATVDYAHDTDDQASGRKIAAPVLVLWGEADALSASARFLETWRRWADDVTAAGIACGHFLPEEAPDEVVGYLEPFLERALLTTT